MLSALINKTQSTTANVFADNKLTPDLSKLFDSFDLLQSTTKLVSDEATNTASYLKEQLNNVTYRFFQVIDSINDLVIIKDGEGRWLTANKFTQQIFGFDPNLHHGFTDLELAVVLNNEGFSQCPISDNKAWSSTSYHREIETFEVDGKIVHFDVVKTPTFHDDGRRKELIVIGRDITKYVESERRNQFLTAALNSASDNILLISNEGIVNFCNDHFLGAFGFNSHQEIEGKSIDIISSKLMTSAFFEKMWSTIKKNELWSGVVINKHTDGRYIKCFVSIIPIMNGSPVPLYYLTTMKTKFLTNDDLKLELLHNEHTVNCIYWTSSDENDSLMLTDNTSESPQKLEPIPGLTTINRHTSPLQNNSKC